MLCSSLPLCIFVNLFFCTAVIASLYFSNLYILLSFCCLFAYPLVNYYVLLLHCCVLPAFSCVMYTLFFCTAVYCQPFLLVTYYVLLLYCCVSSFSLCNLIAFSFVCCILSFPLCDLIAFSFVCCIPAFPFVT